MGQIEAYDLTVTVHLVRYKIGSHGEHRLGLPAFAVTGRAGCLYVDGSETCLVVRNFSVNPSGQYVDIPWKERNCAGSAFEACNINSDLEAVSKLEYHSPAIGRDGCETGCMDETRIRAFCDREQDIPKAASI
jgi:hypothetical protein